MGLTMIPPPGPIDQVMTAVSDATVNDGGCVRITPQEYQDLQSRVEQLGATDRSQFDALVPPPGSERAQGAPSLYGSVIESLSKGQTYDQFVQSLRPEANLGGEAACRLNS